MCLKAFFKHCSTACCPVLLWPSQVSCPTLWRRHPPKIPFPVFSMRIKLFFKLYCSAFPGRKSQLSFRENEAPSCADSWGLASFAILLGGVRGGCHRWDTSHHFLDLQEEKIWLLILSFTKKKRDCGEGVIQGSRVICHSEGDGMDSYQP